ncbi:MAG: methyltransferase domain-containing protein [Deltaproteobacteria bacterium]|nr:methyltransferase domain-containing protein [Deltaproteobacteria bacterium]
MPSRDEEIAPSFEAPSGGPARPIGKLKSAMRRVQLPGFDGDGLVLDIGCGSHPHPRAHFCCDAFSSDAERSAPLKIDRPFVWADAHRLPFKSKSFGFSVFSHVLEHLSDPAPVLREIQRCSRAGYIETPAPFTEFCVPYTFHASRCSVSTSGELYIELKSRWDEGLQSCASEAVYADAMKLWWRLYALDPLLTLTRFSWRDEIRFRVVGQPTGGSKITEAQDDAAGAAPKTESFGAQRSRLRNVLVDSAYALLRPRRFPSHHDLLCCPDCHGELDFGAYPESVTCAPCAKRFPSFRGHLDFRS